MVWPPHFERSEHHGVEIRHYPDNSEALYSVQGDFCTDLPDTENNHEVGDLVRAELERAAASGNARAREALREVVLDPEVSSFWAYARTKPPILLVAETLARLRGPTSMAGE